MKSVRKVPPLHLALAINGMTQIDLARELGISAHAVSMYGRSRSTPNARIAERVGATVEELFGEDAPVAEPVRVDS